VYCTGTLISSTVFLTAAHCDTGTEEVCVSFDLLLTDGRGSTAAFTASPLYSQRQNDPNDLAVVVFDRAVRSIAPSTVVSEVGYLDRLRRGRARPDDRVRLRRLRRHGVHERRRANRSVSRHAMHATSSFTEEAQTFLDQYL
jgi:hypothetical protein